MTEWGTRDSQKIFLQNLTNTTRPRVAARSPMSGASLPELGLPLGGPPASGGRSSTTVRVPVSSFAAGVSDTKLGHGSRCPIRFASLELEWVTPLRIGARIATFHRYGPARCGALGDERRIVAGDEGGACASSSRVGHAWLHRSLRAFERLELKPIKRSRY